MLAMLAVHGKHAARRLGVTSQEARLKIEPWPEVLPGRRVRAKRPDQQRVRHRRRIWNVEGYEIRVCWWARENQHFMHAPVEGLAERSACHGVVVRGSAARGRVMAARSARGPRRPGPTPCHWPATPSAAGAAGWLLAGGPARLRPGCRLAGRDSVQLETGRSEAATDATRLTRAEPSRAGSSRAEPSRDPSA